jgi:hypothetical protein
MKKIIIAALFMFVSQMALAAPGDSCLSVLGLGVIPNGGAAIGYPSPMSQPGFPCTVMTVMCIDGAFIGPDLYPTCFNVEELKP